MQTRTTAKNRGADHRTGPRMSNPIRGCAPCQLRPVRAPRPTQKRLAWQATVPALCLGREDVRPTSPRRAEKRLTRLSSFRKMHAA